MHKKVDLSKKLRDVPVPVSDQGQLASSTANSMAHLFRAKPVDCKPVRIFYYSIEDDK